MAASKKRILLVVIVSIASFTAVVIAILLFPVWRVDKNKHSNSGRHVSRKSWAVEIPVITYNAKATSNIWTDEKLRTAQVKMLANSVKKNDVDFVMLEETNRSATDPFPGPSISSAFEKLNLPNWKTIGSTCLSDPQAEFPGKGEANQIGYDADKWKLVKTLCGNHRSDDLQPTKACSVEVISQYRGVGSVDVENMESIPNLCLWQKVPGSFSRAYAMAYFVLKDNHGIPRDEFDGVLVVSWKTPHSASFAHTPVEDWSWDEFVENAQKVVVAALGKNADLADVNVLIAGDFNEIPFGDQLKYATGNNSFGKLSYSANPLAEDHDETSPSSCCMNDGYRSKGLYDSLASTGVVSAKRIIDGLNANTSVDQAAVKALAENFPDTYAGQENFRWYPTIYEQVMQKNEPATYIRGYPFQKLKNLPVDPKKLANEEHQAVIVDVKFHSDYDIDIGAPGK